jgi:prolyl-tRNA synthetase
LLSYCEDLRAALAKQTALGEPLRVLLDKRPGKATQKRWAWVKKGVPLILEIGGRDASNGQVSVLRRDRLWRDDGKVAFSGEARDEFVARAAAELADIQHALHREASERRDAQIIRNITTVAQLEAVFAEDQKYPGWVELGWSRPTGAALDAVVAKLKALKLTIRNTPLNAAPPSGTCLFTGDLAVETVYVARSY